MPHRSSHDLTHGLYISPLPENDYPDEYDLALTIRDMLADEPDGLTGRQIRDRLRRAGVVFHEQKLQQALAMVGWLAPRKQRRIS